MSTSFCAVTLSQYRTSQFSLFQLEGMSTRCEMGHEHSVRSGRRSVKWLGRLASVAVSEESVKKVLPRTMAFESVVSNKLCCSANGGCRYRKKGQWGASGRLVALNLTLCTSLTPCRLALTSMGWSECGIVASSSKTVAGGCPRPPLTGGRTLILTQSAS